jgi:ParB-like chromosome segregation protein Spo0J
MSMPPPEIIRERVSDLKNGPNIRSDLGPEDALIRHGHSVRKRQRTPLLILPDRIVVDGNRTLAAARLVGIEYLDCIVLDESIDPGTNAAEYRATQWLANEHRQDLSPYDKAVAIRDIKADHPGMTNRQLAEEVLNIDERL